MNPLPVSTPIPRDLPPLFPEHAAAIAARIDAVCAANKPKEEAPETYDPYFEF